MPTQSTRGRWLALIAAYLGWLFDGFEMGIFGIVGKDALSEMLGADHPDINPWFGIIISLFLVGAAAGGVLFGWLGDRLGRVRAMSLSILTYALCTGACGLAQTPLQLAGLRFMAALGMGGEWALGVALVMEVWTGTGGSVLRGVSVRAWLAGVIGSAANLGFALVALLSIGLNNVLEDLRTVLVWMHVPDSIVTQLLQNNGWRMLMLLGITPALLTFFLRLCVPESEKWLKEKEEGRTVHWSSFDLIGVVFGTAVTVGIVLLWLPNSTIGLMYQIIGTLIGLQITILSYLYPVRKYLYRTGANREQRGLLIRRMLLAALLSGVALLGTWGANQWAPQWVAVEIAPNDPTAKSWTQFFSAMGAVFGTIVAAWLGDWLGRRKAYFLLCVLALLSTWGFFMLNDTYGPGLLAWVFVSGWCVGAFYGWIPLYFPEIFPTSVRAIGQGFGYNFGRILAAIGALQTGVLVKHVFNDRIDHACAWVVCIYFIGMAVIWLAPETRGKGVME